MHTTPYAGCVQTSHVTLPLPTTKASSSAWLSSCNSQPCQNPAHIGPGSSSALVALASVVLSTTQQPPFGHLGRTLQTHCTAKRQTYSNRWSATCKHQPQPCQQSSVSPMFKPSSTTSASPPPPGQRERHPQHQSNCQRHHESCLEGGSKPLPQQLTKPTALRFDRLWTQRRKPYWIHKAAPLQPQRSRCYQHPLTLWLNLPPSGFCCCGDSGSPCHTCQPDADATARWIHWGTTGQHALAPELCGQGG